MLVRTAALAALLTPLAAGQVVVNEVLYDPTGPDDGNELIEIHNQGSSDVDLTTWSICVNYPGSFFDNRTYWIFPAGTTIPAGGFLTVHYLADGTDTATDLFTGSTGAGFTCFLPKLMDNSLGSVSLYENAFICAQFDDPALMRYFVQWGGTTFREPVAVSAGLWQSGTWVPVFPEGHSTAYDGDGDTFEDYFEDLSPTIGEANTAPGNPSTAVFGAGCAGSAGVPVLGATGGPPALGNQTFALEVTDAAADAPAILALGFSQASIPALGCTVLVNPVPVLLLFGPVQTSGSGEAEFPLPIPHDPGLVGLSVALQAGVVDSGSPSGIAAFTNGVLLGL